jgi:hypothetical protein
MKVEVLGSANPRSNDRRQIHRLMISSLAPLAPTAPLIDPDGIATVAAFTSRRREI